MADWQNDPNLRLESQEQQEEDLLQRIDEHLKIPPQASDQGTRSLSKEKKSSNTEKKYYKVAELADLEENSVQTVQAGTCSIALTYCKGKLGAVKNQCPHQGGPLGEGSLDEKGILRCPWHGWGFCPVNGTGAENEEDSVESFPVEIREGGIYVQVEE